MGNEAQKFVGHDVKTVRVEKGGTGSDVGSATSVRSRWGAGSH